MTSEELSTLTTAYVDSIIALPKDLEARYTRLCEDPVIASDIREHLPILRQLAERCEHVTEFGFRFGSSAAALLAAKPKTLVSWDISYPHVVSQWAADLGEIAPTTVFQPRVGNTLEITTEPTDLLFLDTLHTAKQLKGELLRHAVDTESPVKKVRKFLVFHDTNTFGMKGEDGSTPGLIDVIRWWRRKVVFPLWRPVLRLENNNGLVVLQRESDVEQNGPFTIPGYKYPA